MRKRTCLAILLSVVILLGFHIASAHEVYVLDQGEISTALHSPRPDFVDTIRDHLAQFIGWGLGIGVLLIISLFISFNRFLETFFTPFLGALKKYAPAVSQFVLGAAVAASGYFHALFGIELTFHSVFGEFEHFLAGLFTVLGIMLMLGIFPRIAGLCVTFIFLLASFHIGIYMLTYLLYLGEALSLLLFGGGYSIHGHHFLSHHFSKKLDDSFHGYKFLIIRITFGISLIYASLYAKFIHGALALETVAKFNLTHYFHFDPVFLVLGAMLVEVILGLCFTFGFLIRLASIFFLTMLMMSLVFFGETVWPHLILIGTAIVMFMHGYDRYTFMFKVQPNKELEPLL